MDRIPSAALVEALAEIEGRPWAEYGKSEKPITQNKLARLLKPLNIVPENIRIDDKVPKGYVLERFKEAFSRYLGPEGASEPQHRYNADEMGTTDLFQTATAETDVADRKSEKPNNDGPCCGVADEKGGQGKDAMSAPIAAVPATSSRSSSATADGPAPPRVQEVVLAGPGRRQKDRTNSVENAPEDRTCAQCKGEIDGTERLVWVSGHAAWLHLGL